jgi:hypothetical protein
MLIPRRLRVLSLLLSVPAALALAAGCARAPSPQVPGAEVVTLAPPFVDLTRLDGSSPLGGDMAEGIAGDWLLRNERLAVVIGGEFGGNRERIGRLLDAAPAGGEDVLCEMRVGASAAPLADPEASYLSVAADSIGAGETGRVLVARGRVREHPDVAIETRYSLEPGSSALSVVTRFVNRGRDTVSLRAADMILWGEAEPFAPGPGFELAEAGESVPFLTGAARGTAYAWWNPQGPLVVSGGLTWSHASAGTASLAPGDSLRIERRLFVRHGSSAEAAAAVWKEMGAAVGYVTIEAHRVGEAIGDVRVVVRGPDGRAWSWGETSSIGRLVLPAPPGRCTILVSHPRYGIAPVSPLSVGAGDTKKVSLHVLDPATVELSAVDERGAASPARWQFSGRAGTSDPWFGPRYSASGAAEYLFTPTGAAVESVPPGRYRVRATRGPGYEAWEQEIDLAPGSRHSMRAELMSIGIPDSWVAADLGVLDRSAPAAPLSAVDRAGALICDGIVWSGAAQPSLSLAAEARELTLTDPGRAGERTYIHAAGPGEAEVRRALQEGKTVSTNGPFVEFTLDGVEIGGTVRRAPGMVKAHVRVLAPAWVDVRRVLIIVNEVVDSAYMVRGRRGPVRFDEDLELYLKNSGFVQVRVEGDEPLPSSSARPLATTAPIGVEISGTAR